MLTVQLAMRKAEQWSNINLVCSSCSERPETGECVDEAGRTAAEGAHAESDGRVTTHGRPGLQERSG